MLETIREYATERLAASGEAEAVRRRHAAFYLALAEEGESMMHSAAQVDWLDRLEAEHDNLRAALAWAIEGHAEMGQRLAGALGWFWERRGYLSEGRDWLARAIARGPDRGAPRATALMWAGHLANDQVDLVAAHDLLGESVALWRALGDRRGLGRALTNAASAVRRLGDHHQARPLFAESIALLRQVDDLPGLAEALWTDARYACHFDRDLEQAHVRAEECMRLARQTEDVHMMARAASISGSVAFAQGDYATAQSFFERGLVLFRKVRTGRWAQTTLEWLGQVAYAQGDYERAETYFREHLGRWQERDRDGFYDASDLLSLGLALLRQGRWQEARAHLAESLALWLAYAHAQGTAGCLVGWAALAEQRGRLERAARLLGASEAVLETVDRSLGLPYQVEHDRVVPAVRAGLDEATFASAWAEGRAMAGEGWERAVAYALEEGAG
jgi:tetratricopeptide (TPR) repeat protein